MPGSLPRVLVTRSAEDAGVLMHALAVSGFEPVSVPLLELRWLPLAVADLAVARPNADLVVVTSATAAEVLAVGAPGAWRTARFAAVGPATARRLGELGYPHAVVPERNTAAHLVEALGDLTGKTVVYPRADLAGPALSEAMTALGARVHEVVAYENVAPAGVAEAMAEALPVAVTTLLSGSAASRLAELVPEARRSELGRVVVIGPSTEAVARARGLAVHAVASPHTLGGLVAAVREALGSPATR